MDVTVDYKKLARACVGGGEAEVDSALVALAGNNPSKEARRRWDRLSLQDKRRELALGLWSLPRRTPVINLQT
jgi:hypothetical protein